MEKIINEIIEDIALGVNEIVENDPNAPIEVVLREVAAGMLMGEDEKVKRKVYKKLGI